MKRSICFFLICFVLFSCCAPVFAASSGSSGSGGSSSSEDPEPTQPVRAIPDSSVQYLGDFPIIPVTSSNNYDVVVVDGIRVARYPNGTLAVASTNSTVYCFRKDQQIYFATFDTSAELYYTTSSSTVSTLAFSVIDTDTGFYCNHISTYFNGSTIPSYIPSYSSESLALAALKEAYDAAQEQPEDPPADVLEAIQRTNDLLSGLYFCLGMIGGIILMREFWRQL